MPTFIFQLVDGSVGDVTEIQHEIDTLDEARSEGRTLLRELVAKGSPDEFADMMSIEIFDAERRPIVELRLTFDQIEKRS
ncbi:hypothetical protein [Rhizobium sp. 2MFCol3.1]|uniref:DUF6894 family protein n=1 Tax=unclassified Rhizobium TaxID=2613769 RepID=UPI00038051C2|nr:hypothetical protein [Rhizobium sp. 2MFCol3.1]